MTALVGLAPWSRDSGRKQGQRSIRGGRAVVRRALYMASLAAIRGSGSLPDFYRQLRQRGKSGKVALVAVMCKLLLQLNAVARRGTPWTQTPWVQQPGQNHPASPNPQKGLTLNTDTARSVAAHGEPVEPRGNLGANHDPKILSIPFIPSIQVKTRPFPLSLDGRGLG